MHYIKQKDYDNFICIANKCPESCCKMWEIVIDDKSLDKYSQLSGEFGDSLRSKIDWDEGVFKQNNGICALLNKDELCSLQLHEGESALCDTCRLYPRHMEEYEGLREYSLSLSCPAVAEAIIKNNTPIEYVEEDDDLEDDFEDFDYLLFSKLTYARDVIIDITKSSNSLIEKMSRIMNLSCEMQNCLDESIECDMDNIIQDYVDDSDKGSKYDYQDKRIFSVLFELECLHKGWRDSVDSAWENLFSNKTDVSDSLFLDIDPDTENALCRLLESMIFTYYCGAVYDDMIFSKAALCVYFARWIYILYKTEIPKTDNVDVLIRITYQLAREIEHSEDNLCSLDVFFEESMPQL